MTDTKTCPLCNSDAELRKPEFQRRYSVECTHCGFYLINDSAKNDFVRSENQNKLKILQKWIEENFNEQGIFVTRQIVSNLLN